MHIQCYRSGLSVSMLDIVYVHGHIAERAYITGTFSWFLCFTSYALHSCGVFFSHGIWSYSTNIIWKNVSSDPIMQIDRCEILSTATLLYILITYTKTMHIPRAHNRLNSNENYYNYVFFPPIFSVSLFYLLSICCWHAHLYYNSWYCPILVYEWLMAFSIYTPMGILTFSSESFCRWKKTLLYWMCDIDG